MKSIAITKKELALEELQEKIGRVRRTMAAMPAPSADEDRCEVCGGLGVVYADAIPTDPHYGKLVECPAQCVTVLDNRDAVNRRQMDGMMRKTKRESAPFRVMLADYEAVSQDGDRRFGRDIAEVFIVHQMVTVGEYRKRSVVLTGATGTGKTFLASVISNELEARGVVCWYMRFSEMLQRVQECYDVRSDMQASDVIRALQRVRVLILDDWGLHRRSDDRMDIVEAIIDYRYTHDLPTILTTNLDQNTLRDNWGDRVWSRLVHMAHWVQIDGNMRNQNPIL